MELQQGNAAVAHLLPEAVALLGESVPHMLWLATSEGIPLYQNAAWRDYTGGASLDSSWRETLAHPDDAERLRAEWTTAFREGRAFNGECRYRRHDDTWHWFLDRMAPVVDHDGSHTHWIGTLTEVDSLKLAEQELTALLRGRDEYMAALGHGLRSPLQALRQALFVMNLPGVAPAETAKMHRTAEHQIAEIARFCEDLVDVNRLRWDAMSLALVDTTVQEIVEAAVASASPQIKQREHSLAVRLENPGAGIMVDEVRLTQALVNLLDNAAKYTDPRGHITLTASSRNGSVEFAVEDSGRGMDPETLPRIFDLFSRGAPAEPTDGFGIGLALVRRVALLHGGEVDAHSDGPGRGSRFRLRIPLTASSRT
jgi:PAS domain S-box-containing protein